VKKILFLLFIIFNLYALDGMYNLRVDTFDKSEVLQKVEDKLQKVDFSHLKNDLTYQKHIDNINLLNHTISQIIELKSKDKELYQRYKSLQEKLNNLEQTSTKRLKKVTKRYRNVKRTTYFVVLHKLNEDYKQELQNHLIDKYAITKYKQDLKIVIKNDKKNFKYTIENQKDFGLMKQEILDEKTYRDKNLHFVLIKVTQYPFKDSKSSLYNQKETKKVDIFKETSTKIIHIESINGVKEKIEPILSTQETNQILKSIKTHIKVSKAQRKLKKSTKKIKSIVKEIYKNYNYLTKKLNYLLVDVSNAKKEYEQNSKNINELYKKALKTAKYYNIELKFDELEKIIILSPREYQEYVEVGEESDFVYRKIKRYLLNITLKSVAQTEKIVNFYDLDIKNIDKFLLLQYSSIHFMPFIKEKKMGVVVFATLKIEKKITKNDFIKKELKYATLEFLPIQKGYERIFISTTELPIGVIKEFLETKRKKTKHYFDKYCLEDSTLPKEAKDFKNVSSNYYDYPAVCYKLEKIDDILKWLSKKIHKKVILPTPQEWSYIASNANTTKYCWGNKEIEELLEDEIIPENIYIENEEYKSEEEPKLYPIKSFPPSKLGIYDMCGNGYELVKDGDEYYIKGNSYISYIEESNAPALEYDYTLNPSITLRVEYKQNK
jgi:hypothetical protein